MRFELKFKILLWKYYFDKGFSLTNNLKYLIGLFALYEVVNVKGLRTTIILGSIWALSSFLIGWWWYRKDWNSVEIEIQNRINPFVREMRDKLNGKI